MAAVKLLAPPHAPDRPGTRQPGPKPITGRPARLTRCAYLYGLMAGGRAGVDRMIAILRSDIERTMRLLGAISLEELAPHHVTLPEH